MQGQNGSKKLDMNHLRNRFGATTPAGFPGNQTDSNYKKNVQHTLSTHYLPLLEGKKSILLTNDLTGTLKEAYYIRITREQINYHKKGQMTKSRVRYHFNTGDVFMNDAKQDDNFLRQFVKYLRSAADDLKQQKGVAYMEKADSNENTPVKEN